MIGVEDESRDVMMKGNGTMNLNLFVIGYGIRIKVFADAGSNFEDGDEFIIIEGVEDVDIMFATRNSRIAVG